jgi:hypothetical protein
MSESVSLEINLREASPAADYSHVSGPLDHLEHKFLAEPPTGGLTDPLQDHYQHEALDTLKSFCGSTSSGDLRTSIPIEHAPKIWMDDEQDATHGPGNMAGVPIRSSRKRTKTGCLSE